MFLQTEESVTDTGKAVMQKERRPGLWDGTREEPQKQCFLCHPDKVQRVFFFPLHNMVTKVSLFAPSPSQGKIYTNED